MSAFTDIASLSVETRNSIDRLHDLGITKGTTTTTFSPHSYVTRWQMAVFMDRLLIEIDAMIEDALRERK